MAMDFKRLAKLCVEAEMNHRIKRKPGEPMAQLGVEGYQMKGNCFHILTAPENHPDLMGKPIKYVKDHDLTIIDVACRDIRSFFNSMNWTIEEFIDEKTKVLH